MAHLKAILIESKANPKIKQALSLKKKRERDDSGLFIIEGFRELLRAIQSGVALKYLFICPELFLGENEEGLITQAGQNGAEIYRTSEKIFQTISYRDRPDGLFAIAHTMKKGFHTLEEKLKGTSCPLIVVAEAIEKPGNLGTILRSADGAGATGVIVCDRCTDIYNPNVVRSSVGTLFTLPVIEATKEETYQWLQKRNIQIVSATPHGNIDYWNADFKKSSAIVFGTEQLGLSEFWMKNCTVQVKIAMHGVADSLNVAMASTILLYEAARQRAQSIIRR